MEDVEIEDDIDVAVRIFFEALSYRPQIPRGPLGEHFQTLTLQQIATETLTPRVQVLFFGPDGRVPCLFFRFVGNEFPTVEAILYPIEPILSFLAESRAYIQRLNLTDRTEQNKEELARKMAIEMTLIMIDSFYERSRLTIDSYISEVVDQWHLQHSKNMRHWTAERGDVIPPGQNPWLRVLREAIQFHARELSKFWKIQAEPYEAGDKIRFAEEYDILYNHWKIIGRISSEDNWRDYALATHPDTPNDLLDRLENTARSTGLKLKKRISELALEHAGRRAGLLKQRGISEAVRRLRKAGVRVTGYTSGQLFEFLKQGQRLRKAKRSAQVNFEKVSEQKGDSTHDTK